jgi:hypothetical protein
MEPTDRSNNLKQRAATRGAHLEPSRGSRQTKKAGATFEQRLFLPSDPFHLFDPCAAFLKYAPALVHFPAWYHRFSAHGHEDCHHRVLDRGLSVRDQRA